MLAGGGQQGPGKEVEFVDHHDSIHHRVNDKMSDASFRTGLLSNDWYLQNYISIATKLCSKEIVWFKICDLVTAQLLQLNCSNKIGNVLFKLEIVVESLF